MADPQTVWSAVAAIAAAVGAGGALWTLAEIKRDSRDRTRPMMSAELRAAVLTQNPELHICNRGQSVAKNIRVSFDPPLPVLEGSEAEGLPTPFLQRRYGDVITTLTPGLVLDNIWNSATTRV